MRYHLTFRPNGYGSAIQTTTLYASNRSDAIRSLKMYNPKACDISAVALPEPVRESRYPARSAGDDFRTYDVSPATSTDTSDLDDIHQGQ